MKKYIILFALIILSPLSFNVASAAQCTAPTQPVQYKTVPVYQSTGLQSDGAIVVGDGMIISSSGNLIPAPTKQVQVDTTNDPMYQSDLLSYSLCQQINSGAKVFCFEPVALCNENLYGGLLSQAAMYGVSGTAQDRSVQCRQQINDYKAQMSTYNSCLSSRNAQNPSDTPVVDVNASCKNSYGIHAIISPTKTGYCSCQSGYAWGYNDQCVLQATLLTITTDSFPDAIINKPYSANINFTYSGNDTPVIRFNGIPDGLYFDYINSNAYNGSFSFKLISRKVGQYTFNADVEINNVKVASSTFGLNVVDPSQVQAVIPAPTVAPEVTPTITTKIKNNTPIKIETQKSKPRKPDLIKTIATSTINEHLVSSTTRITTEHLASSTPETPKIPEPHKTPPQKHWYQWLNPFSWFR